MHASMTDKNSSVGLDEQWERKEYTAIVVAR